jgi:hypothetical protein
MGGGVLLIAWHACYIAVYDDGSVYYTNDTIPKANSYFVTWLLPDFLVRNRSRHTMIDESVASGASQKDMYRRCMYIFKQNAHELPHCCSPNSFSRDSMLMHRQIISDHQLHSLHA